MNLEHVDFVFQIIVFLFAISFHESAHAWMALRCGDNTGNSEGRISLNPLRHIDPIGTVLMPALGMLTGAPVLGWAKPVPVNPLKFKKIRRDNVLVAVVGPLSNLILVAAAFVLLLLISLVSEQGRLLVKGLIFGYLVDAGSLLMPLVLLLYTTIVVNLRLAVFNLIPLPPLDGSHVLGHFLPDSVADVYQYAGMGILMLLVFMRVPLTGPVVAPVMRMFDSILLKL